MIGRLSASRAFSRLRAEGTRDGRGPVRLVVRPDAQEPPRFAYAIPRSVGSAVVRNRIKRRVRAVIQQLDADTPGGIPGGDHLIRVTAPIDDWDHAKLASVMHDLLSGPPVAPPESRT